MFNRRIYIPNIEQTGVTNVTDTFAIELNPLARNLGRKREFVRVHKSGRAWTTRVWVDTATRFVSLDEATAAVVKFGFEGRCRLVVVNDRMECYPVGTWR